MAFKIRVGSFQLPNVFEVLHLFLSELSVSVRVVFFFVDELSNYGLLLLDLPVGVADEGSLSRTVVELAELLLQLNDLLVELGDRVAVFVGLCNQILVFANESGVLVL